MAQSIPPLEEQSPVATEPSPLALDYAPATAKRWYVGTLSYTAAGLVVLFCWLLAGDFAWSLKERSIADIFTLLIKKCGAKDLTVSLFIVSVPAVFGVVIGPMVSYRSDRVRTRWGRRIPYLMAATPFAVLAMCALGITPAIGHAIQPILGARSPGENQTNLILFGLFWIIFDIATVVINTLFYALINDVVPREFLGRFFGLFRALSLIAGMVVNYKIFGLAEFHYTSIFIGLGLVYGIGFTVMCLKVKEGQYPPPPDLAQSEKPGMLTATKIYIRECFANPYYLWVIIAFTLANIAFLPVNTYNLFFALSLHTTTDAYGKFRALTYLISLCLSYPFGALADRFHPLRVGIVTMVAYAVVTFWGGVYAVTPGTFAFAMVAHGVLSGVFFSCTASYTQKLFPQSRFAQFYSAYWLMFCVGQVVTMTIVGKYLDLSGHDYRQTYLITCVLTVISVLCMLEVYRRFRKFGGPDAYVAPE